MDRSSPHLVWNNDSAVMVYCLENKEEFIIGSGTACDIFVSHPDRARAEIYAKITRCNGRFTITPLRSIQLFVNGEVVPPGSVKDLTFGDVFCIGVRSGVRVLLKNGQIRDSICSFLQPYISSRPYLTWTLAQEMGAYLLDGKTKFVIGNERACDITIINGKLRNMKIEVFREGNLDRTFFTAVFSSKQRNAALYVNGHSIAWKSRCILINGDRLNFHNDTGSVALRFYCPSEFPISSRNGCFPELGQAAHVFPAEAWKELNRLRASPLQSRSHPLFLLCNSLEEALTCSICLCIFYKPASVYPCYHKFCSFCIARWNDENLPFPRCPQCRRLIRDICPDPILCGILDALYIARPGLRRSSDASDGPEKL